MNLAGARASVPTLLPSAAWWPLFDSGKVVLNEAANRLVWADSGRFAAALVPTRLRGVRGLASKIGARPGTLG